MCFLEIWHIYTSGIDLWLLSSVFTKQRSSSITINIVEKVSSDTFSKKTSKALCIINAKSLEYL